MHIRKRKVVLLKITISKHFGTETIHSFQAVTLQACVNCLLQCPSAYINALHNDTSFFCRQPITSPLSVLYIVSIHKLSNFKPKPKPKQKSKSEIHRRQEMQIMFPQSTATKPVLKAETMFLLQVSPRIHLHLGYIRKTDLIIFRKYS